jgi:hypothetical protein
LGGNARSDRDCNPGDLAVHDLALARVHSSPYLEAEVGHGVPNCAGAADRADGTVEAGEAAVTSA